MNSFIQLRNISRKLKNGLDREGILVNGLKILKFLGKMTNLQKIQDHQHLMNNFHRAGKIKKPACKKFRAWTRKDPNSKKLRFFDPNLYGKWTFFIIFTKFSTISASESIYLGKITPFFYNFFGFSGGKGERSPSLRHGYM